MQPNSVQEIVRVSRPHSRLSSRLLCSGVLCLLEHDEEYVFTLPSAYARSILTVPWVELGGKVSIGCAKSGYSATVTFHTKPFYGGKVHRWATLLSGWRSVWRQGRP